MRKWSVIGGKPDEKRYDALQSILKKNGCENSFEMCLLPERTNKEKFIEILEEQKGKSDVIRIERPFGQLTLEFFEGIPSEILSLRCVDTIVKVGDVWWPKNFLHVAIGKLLSQSLPATDFKLGAMLVGSGVSIRSSVSALSKLGFKRMTLVDRFTERSQALVEEFRTLFFGVKFEAVPSDTITMMPGVHQIIVNSTPNVYGNELTRELSFFNYLASNGVVIDLREPRDTSGLIPEAESIGAVTVDSIDVTGWMDLVWAEKNMSCSFDVKEYQELLR